MRTIDDIGRRAGRDALADAATLADVDAGLARVLADADSDGGREPRTAGRRWAVLVAAATVAAATVALVVVSQDDSPEPLAPVEPSTVPDVTTRPTTPVTTTTATAPTTSPPTSLVPAVDDLGVSYVTPPPLLSPQVFATVEVAEASSVAVSPTGGVVVVDQATGTATVVEPDGSTRAVPVAVVPSYLAAAGPGDVVYGLRYEEGPGMPEASMVAIALSGDRAGEVIASAPVDPNTSLELPVGAFGNGPTGVVDRTRQVGTQVIGYVDLDGQPVEWPGTAPPLVTMDADSTVRSTAGQAWPLRIERDPGWTASFDGESPPAPSASGGTVIWTSIGPPVDPDADYSEGTIPVVAELAPDGTATWWQLPEGWSVAASDVGGTILARRDGDQLQFARLTELAVSPIDPVAELAEAIGVSTVVTRSPGLATVYTDGATTEVVTPPEAYVRSDGEFLWWIDETTSTAATLDGTVVCEIEGMLHRIRAESDGGYVASVENQPTYSPTGEETPVPNFAVDCESGERQPIESISWTREGGWRSVHRVGDRTFQADGDAEGNADLVNESGISINGDDYAGSHEFNDDGSQVVYGDYGASSNGSALATEVIRSRDTTSGELLWSLDLGRPFLQLLWFEDRILATFAEANLAVDSFETTSVTVIDATTGTVRSTVPTELEIAYVG